MRVEVLNGVTFLYPDEHKKIKRLDDNSLFSNVALAKSDSPENYEEVDELWTPESDDSRDLADDLFEDINRIEPDAQGKVEYSDVRKIVDAMNIMKKRVIELENKINK